jgi:hypothetical protein
MVPSGTTLRSDSSWGLRRFSDCIDLSEFTADREQSEPLFGAVRIKSVALIWVGDEFESFGTSSLWRQIIRTIVGGTLAREAGSCRVERRCGHRQVPNQ